MYRAGSRAGWATRRRAPVLAQPVPDGYTPLSLRVDPLDGLQVDQYEMPVLHPFSVEGLGEHVLVHQGAVRTTIPLRLTRNLGSTTLALRMDYPACTHTVCFPPAILRVDLSLDGCSSPGAVCGGD
jgi:Disulphide bond corrector protein DsbC